MPEDSLTTEPTATGASQTSEDREVLAVHDVVTVAQKTLRANLEEMKLKQTRLLLTYQGEGLEKKLTEDMDSAQEAIQRAKEVEEREKRRRRLEEEREREKKEAERRKR